MTERRLLALAAACTATWLCTPGPAAAAAVQYWRLTLDNPALPSSSGDCRAKIAMADTDIELHSLVTRPLCATQTPSGAARDPFAAAQDSAAVLPDALDLAADGALDFNSALFELTAEPAALGIAAAEATLDRFRAFTSGVSESSVDDFVLPHDETEDSGGFLDFIGDFRIEDAVPALAIVALLVAGLLLLGLLRRRRRALLVRRLKQTLGRQRRRSHGRSRVRPAEQGRPGVVGSNYPPQTTRSGRGTRRRRHR